MSFSGSSLGDRLQYSLGHWCTTPFINRLIEWRRKNCDHFEVQRPRSVQDSKVDSSEGKPNAHIRARPEAFREVPPKGEGEAAPRSLRITGFRANLETLALDLRFSFRTLWVSE